MPFPKKAVQKAVVKKPQHVASAREKQPEFMVHIADPKMLRKDVLESLRDIIIFMQGYERFRKIQDEKVALFGALRAKVREINSLVDGKLRRYFPKGKLKAAMPKHHREMPQEPVEEAMPATPRGAPQGLDSLEAELQEIEGKLQGV